MNRVLLSKAGLLAVVIVMGGTAGCADTTPGAHKGDRVCFDRQCVAVEVARTREELSRGLQSREELVEDSGMLFVFSSSGLYRFWMKDTLIPLDIVWLDDEGRVVDIVREVPPCLEEPCEVYVPKGKARYVLEINAGSAERLEISAGDRAALNIASDDRPSVP